MLRVEYFHRSFYDGIDNDQEPKKISAIEPVGMCWSRRLKQLDYSGGETGKNYFWNEAAGQQEKPAVTDKIGSLVRDFCDRLVGVDIASPSLIRWQEGSVVHFAEEAAGRKLRPRTVASHSCGILYFAEKSAVYYAMPENFSIVKAFFQEDLDPLCIAFARDESLFFLSDRTSGNLLMFDFEHDATLIRPRTFAFNQDFPSGAPTGIVTDPCGRVYCASPSGVHVFDSAGLHLAQIEMPGKPVTIAIGGRGGKTLFTGTSEGVFTIELNI
jgi:sugar lactone lactonase YvrE